jgi:hypothetical protein
MFVGATYCWHDNRAVQNEFKGKISNSVDVKKVWVPAEGHPDSVTVQLYLNGTPYRDPVVLNADNSWAYEWTELNVEGSWTVDEIDVPEGYEKSITGDAIDGFEIKNTKEQPPDDDIDISVKKVWVPAEGHPQSVTVQLYKNGAAEGSPVTLNAGNDWTHKWSKFSKNNTWTVDEIEVPNGYTKSRTGNDAEGYVITNTKDTPTDPKDPEDPKNPKDPKDPDDPRNNIPDDGVPWDGRDPDPNADIPEGGIPGGGRDPDPNNIPKTGDEADPRLWLMILAVSTLILRHELFFRKKKHTQYQK